ncbi:MAG: nucleotide exchange factor GrpE [Betaproteobacteria bacterium]|nr:MAG: nucleotide exchange factor GrpE [Betaproteobacteria bacterium]
MQDPKQSPETPSIAETPPVADQLTAPDAAPAAALDAASAPPAGAPPESSTRAAAEIMPGLEEALRLAELKAAEHHDAWLRAKAEAENIRRRAQDDIAKASKFAAEKFATAMLPVKDSLEAALAVENQTLEKLREGVELTLRQLAAAFDTARVVEENPVGQKFDPNKHQAISAIESDAEPNSVVNVLQKGYLLNERVIRPALVMVAKTKTASPQQ